MMDTDDTVIDGFIYSPTDEHRDWYTVSPVDAPHLTVAGGPTIEAAQKGVQAYLADPDPDQVSADITDEQWRHAMRASDILALADMIRGSK